jgi:hypothetical protein
MHVDVEHVSCSSTGAYSMNAKELADRFSAKVAQAVVESDKQKIVADDEKAVRLDDAACCKAAMADKVLPFLSQLQSRFPKGQFSFATQIDLGDHKPIGVSFKIGDGPTTTIWTAFGNVSVTQTGDSGSPKGVSFIYPSDQEPYISNSGDLTSSKIAKLVEMVIDNSP